jgi:peptidoglycan/xylan/chitin deacetylase (PgdA/CDA1 family)
MTRNIGILVIASALAPAACSSSAERSSGERSASSKSPLLTETTYGGNTDNDLPPKTVILTFDDGPDGPPGSATADMTVAIAQYLAGQGISATFFVNGRRFLGQQPTSGCPLFDSGGVPGVGHASGPFKQYDESVLDTLVQLGHRIANHTQDHCQLGSNTAFVDSEILPTQTILDRHAFDGPFLFRPPYGSWSAADETNARADACLDKLEGPVNWDVDAGDWGCWSPTFQPSDPNPWPSSGGVGACLQGYMNVLFGRANKNGVFLHHDRPEPAVATPDMYGPGLAGANHYTAQSVTITNADGSLTTLPGAYPSNELGLIQAEVTYLQSQGYRFARTDDIYSGKRVRNWSNAVSCAANQPAGALDYENSDTGGASGPFSASPSYYRSFHLADVNGDGLSDACARSGAGIECATNRGNGQFNPHTMWISEFTDGEGWNGAPYGTTVQFADVNADGVADVCGRGGAGIYCAISNGVDAFGPPALVTSGVNFSDDVGWNGAESYYGSIHFADVNGDGWADVCGRAVAGITCALNGAAAGGAVQFGAATTWMGADFTDSVGWEPPQYGATVQLGDIDGDGLADVCGRGGAGMRCALATSAGSFAPPTWWTTWPDFSDNDGKAGDWAQPGYYKSIRLVDVNQDGLADVCGRSTGGIVCGLSNGARFLPYTIVGHTREIISGTATTTWGEDYTDALGWVPDSYGSTIQFGHLDYNGLADVCGRGAQGLLCSLAP